MAPAERVLRRALRFALLLLALLAAVVVVRALAAGSRQAVPAAEADAYAPDPDAIAARLAGALRFRTVSLEESAPVEAQAFAELREYLATTWPRVHATLERELIGGHSLLYTWKGRDPAAPALLLAAHQDVVPVPAPDQWKHPPFAGAIADGEVWGRGALDDKASLVCILEAVESLLAQGFTPERTLYLAFGHDEEIGGHAGARAIAQTLASRGVRLAAALDEGGAVADGFVALLERPVAAIGVAEKGYLDVRLRARAQGGHSSTPPRRSAIGDLSAALLALDRHQLPARTGGTFERMAAHLAPEVGFGPRLALANLWLVGPLIPLVSRDVPILDAMIRTTTAPTIVRGGVKSNVLPSEAEAIVNFRILPGDTIASVLEHVRRAANSAGVEVENASEDGGQEASPVSSDDGPAFRGIAGAARAIYPDAVPVPYLVVGATDARHYAPLGDAIYRLLPFRIGDEALHLAHGTDERIAVANLVRGVRFYREWIRRPLPE